MGSIRARFRFRVGKKLHIKEREQRFQADGREIVLGVPVPEKAILESEWLAMNIYGFDTEDQAREYAARLKLAVEIAAAASKIGVDSGRDLPTSGLGAEVRQQLLAEKGVHVRDNVHGVDIFRDAGNVRVFSVSATASVLADPGRFLGCIQSIQATLPTVSSRTRDAALLLNFALLRPEPVAQIVFCISAVEMLGQDEAWTPAQRELIEQAASSVEGLSLGSDAERAEVAEAMRRGLHKLSLRQGTFRLLAQLGLGSLKRQWDSLYSDRSKLVHGLAPQPGADYSGLASRAVSLCGRVLLTFISKEVPQAVDYLDQLYLIEPPPA